MEVGRNAEAAPPTVRGRVLVACAIGLLALTYGFANTRFVRATGGGYGDYIFTWRAARFVMQGHDPYAAIINLGWYPFNSPFFYPLPAAILSVPLAPLQPEVAKIAFGAISAALLAFGITRDGYYRLPVFLSFPFQYACLGGQYGPLLTAAALLPWLGFILAAKPNVGLALFAYNPSWRAAIGCALFVAFSFAVLPTWPVGWWRAVHDPLANAQYRAPIFSLGGPLLLLAVLRWRRPEARLLLVVALIPQNLLPYEAVPVFLIPRTFRESLTLAVLSAVAFLLSTVLLPPVPALLEALKVYPGLMIALVYLPALWMVLRRPNEGDVPAPVARLADAAALKVRDWAARHRDPAGGPAA